MAGLDGEGGRWDEFDIAAEAFQEMVEEQKESLKGVLEEEVMELNQVGGGSASVSILDFDIIVQTARVPCDLCTPAKMAVAVVRCLKRE